MTSNNPLKISLCIPQYNRIDYLIKNLKTIEQQSYFNIEVVISDDCSTDDTENTIQKLITHYKYPLIYHRNIPNKGYDFNLRKSMELASGDYCFILGNDDTLWGDNAIEFLIQFLEINNLPEVGFCNFIEDHDHTKIIERASQTGIIGSGYDCAIKHYRSFSFVAGIIYKRSAFNIVNTPKFDGSVFVQMYFAARLIGSGMRFFTIKEPLVLKDLLIDSSMANSYRDTLPRKWIDFKPLNGGIPGVIKVGVTAFTELNHSPQICTFTILKGIYRFSYTYWLLDYRHNRSFVGACGFVSGLYPSKLDEFCNLNLLSKIRIYFIYAFSTIIGLLTPLRLFRKLKHSIYNIIKR